MKRKTISGVVLGLLLIGLGASVAVASICEPATFMDLPPDTIITSAGLVSPGANIGGQLITVPFCRVQVTHKMPYDIVFGDADVYSEVWLPTTTWNGRYLGTGNGGSAPTISYSALNSGIKAGYATANTSMGTHSDPPLGSLDFRFGNGHPQRWINFGVRSTHAMSVAAKAITKAFYEQAPQYSYFTGCSTGGQQAMAEAQSHPEDYDGIVVGAGAFDRTHVHMKGIWVYQTNHFKNPPEDFTFNDINYIPAAKFPYITQAVIAACDALDGVVDGIIDDPRNCHFDPMSMLCQGPETDSCLTAAQAATMAKIWKGVFNPRTGVQIVPGLTIGSESNPWGTGSYIGPPPNQPQLPILNGLINWALGADFDGRYFDWDQDVAIVDDTLASIVNFVDPDLSPLNARGGKVLMWHGWADPLVYSMDSPNYYEKVLKKMGGLKEVKNFARLFMAPGVGHCGYGGPGPNVFDSLGALVNWVENGKAPDQIIALRVEPLLTRPLCAYPEVARWNGIGDKKVAENFMCVPPVEVRIEPETLNLKSKGVFTAFITVPEGYDGRDWGISDLKCQGADMVKSSVSHDGRTYIAKFNRQDLINVAAGEAVTFKVEGLFKKGGKQALLLGYDTLRVIK